MAVTTEGEPTMEDVLYVNNKAFGGYVCYRGNPVPNTCHTILRNHENLCYANNKNVLNRTLGFNEQKGEDKPSSEDLVGIFVVDSKKRIGKNESYIDNIETHMINICATTKSLKT